MQEAYNELQRLARDHNNGAAGTLLTLFTHVSSHAQGTPTLDWDIASWRIPCGDAGSLPLAIPGVSRHRDLEGYESNIKLEDWMLGPDNAMLEQQLNMRIQVTQEKRRGDESARERRGGDENQDVVMIEREEEPRSKPPKGFMTAAEKLVRCWVETRF
jgi:hypothetical protein